MIGCLVFPFLEAEAELYRRPDLAGKAFAISSGGRVRAVSAEAAHAGVEVGLTTGRAQALCPELTLLPYDAGRYAAAQERALVLCTEYVDALEPVSLTEVFFTVPAVGQAKPFLSELAAAVTARLGLTCRFGAGPSKLVAKLAARSSPGRLVADEDAAGFLAPLPIEQLWPLDARTAQRLRDLGLATVGLLHQISDEMLARHFGARARRLKELALGVDRAPARHLYPPPKAAARVAVPEATEDATAIEAMLREAAAQVAAQLSARGQVCRRVSLRVETEGGRMTRHCALSRATAEAEDLLLAAQRLWLRAEVTTPVSAVLLRSTELERRPQVQFSLLEVRAEQQRARADLARAVELVRREFGERGARWAGEREVPRRERMLACWQRQR